MKTQLNLAIAASAAPPEAAVSATAGAPPEAPAAWAGEFREREWSVIGRLFAAAEHALDSLLRTDPTKLTLSDVAKAVEITSGLGRVAAGIESAAASPSAQEAPGTAAAPQFHAALDRVYGQPLPDLLRQLGLTPPQA